MSKDYQKKMRIKYLRKLEKFAHCANTILKKEDFNASQFRERMLKNSQIFEENCELNLHSSYTKALEAFVKACLDFSKEKDELISLANALDKQRKQSEKKEKYKNYLREYE